MQEKTAIVLAAIVMSGIVVQEGYARMAEINFVGFPHRGKFVQFVPADKPDEEAATRHFEKLFLGKDLDFVRAVCDTERKFEENGKHDAQHIYCGSTINDPNVYEVSYRFAVKNENGEPIPVALVWTVRLTVEKEVVGAVDAGVSVLSP